MKITKTVRNILENYKHNSPGVNANLARIMCHGALAGTGKMVIYPVDQGFEHGPDRSFTHNPESLDPMYHLNFAIDAKMNALAAPLGFIETIASESCGQMRLILKLNGGMFTRPKSSSPDQAVVASVDDALRLGCTAVGLTIYPGSGNTLEMLEEAAELTKEAKSKGLPMIIWSYSRGEDISKAGETAIDITNYGAQVACLIGADIVKVKPPVNFVETSEAKKVMEKHKIDYSTLEKRIKMVKNSCFAGRRMVIFSGGEATTDEQVFEEITSIHKGGGNGSIIGRNAFKRPKEDALKLISKIIDIYKS